MVVLALSSPVKLRWSATASIRRRPGQLFLSARGETSSATEGKGSSKVVIVVIIHFLSHFVVVFGHVLFSVVCFVVVVV